MLLKDLQDLTQLMHNDSTLFQGTKSKYGDNILYCVSRGIPDTNNLYPSQNVINYEYSW